MAYEFCQSDEGVPLAAASPNLTSSNRCSSLRNRGDIFGRGVHHDVYLKCLLKQIANNLEQLFENSKRIEWKPKQPGGGGEHWSVFRDRLYHDLTGFSYTRVKEINQELKENGNRLQPAKDRGPPPRDLHNEVPGLRAWFEEQAEKANKGGYLTVKKLQATL